MSAVATGTAGPGQAQAPDVHTGGACLAELFSRDRWWFNGLRQRELSCVDSARARLRLVLPPSFKSKLKSYLVHRVYFLLLFTGSLLMYLKGNCALCTWASWRTHLPGAPSWGSGQWSRIPDEGPVGVTDLEARRLKPRCQKGWLLVEPLGASVPCFPNSWGGRRSLAFLGW